MPACSHAWWKRSSLDASMLGNLIYQAEMGRSDMKNFFRWLTRHATDDPTTLDRIRAEEAAGDGARPLAEAFVQETLRTDQSERLIRIAKRDIVFDGFLIPRHATIRLCLWESHHAECAFADPHRFDPERFLTERPGNDRFAPFGVRSSPVSDGRRRRQDGCHFCSRSRPRLPRDGIDGGSSGAWRLSLGAGAQVRRRIEATMTNAGAGDLDQNLFALFARQAARRPDAKAVIDDTGATTYGALLTRACVIADALNSARAGRGATRRGADEKDIRPPRHATRDPRGRRVLRAARPGRSARANPAHDRWCQMPARTRS